jgi:hypothetical protein
VGLDVSEIVVASARDLDRPYLAAGAVPLEPDPDGAHTFLCPTCGKRFRYGDPLEPLCTGPSESRDEHEPTAMLRIGFGS